MTLSTVQMGDSWHAMGILRDVTEQKRTEAERDQLIQDLQQALSKVKSLRGLLPICASCKTIRDDRGYWSQEESYVQAHSDATFTHGTCPDCLQRFSPDLSHPDPRDNKQLNHDQNPDRR